MHAADSKHYLSHAPLAWRFIAAAQALGGAFFAPVLAPAAVYIAFPRSRFLRAHAMAAGVAQLLGVLIVALLKLPSLLFIIEEQQYFVTVEQIFGQLFAEMSGLLGLFLLYLIGFATLTLALTPLSVALDRSGRRRFRASAAHAIPALLIAVLISPPLFYSQALWGGAGPGQAPGLLGLSNERFLHDPYSIFPGHVVLVWCLMLSILAMRGRVALLWPASRFFVRAEREQRMQGEARYRAAMRRAAILPGWGQYYSGERIAGLCTLCLAALLALFGFFSLALNYGAAVEGRAGLNANVAWQFLSTLGLRGHKFSDGELKAIFGSGAALAALGGAMLLCVTYSLASTYWIYRRPRAGRFLIYGGVSLLAHAAPAAILLLIPITVLSPPPAANEQQPEVEYSIPPLTDPSQDELNGSRPSGEEGQSETIALAPPEAQRGEEQNGDEALAQGSRSARPPSDLAPGDRNSNAEDTLQGERTRQTYSNYISAKIRAGERSVHYWSSTPQPYAVVVEYRISRGGRVSQIRVRERSAHSQADELTIQLVQSMGDLLPPPGGREVQVTELFWNTSPADPNLPTPLMRELAKQFDGRIIEPLQ